MKRYSISLILACLLTGCSTTSITLQEYETGHTSGPFALRDGNMIEVGGKMYVVQMTPHPTGTFASSKGGPVVPEISTRRANLIDVLTYLETEGQKNAPGEQRIFFSLQIDIADPALKVRLTDSETLESIFHAWEGKRRVIGLPTTVTMRMRHWPVLSIVHELAASLSMEYRREGNDVIFFDPRVQK